MDEFLWQDRRVLAYLPVGILAIDAGKIILAIDELFPGAMAQTSPVPPGIAMAILRPPDPEETS